MISSDVNSKANGNFALYHFRYVNGNGQLDLTIMRQIHCVSNTKGR